MAYKLNRTGSPLSREERVKMDENWGIIEKGLSETKTQLNNIIIKSGTSDAETIQARGEFPVLNDRLDSVNQQLAGKANDSEVRRSSVPITLNDASADLLAAIQGGGGTSFNLLSIPRDNSVTLGKTTFMYHGKNYFDSSNLFKDKTIGNLSGNMTDRVGASASDYIEVLPGEVMTQNYSFVIAFYDEHKAFISGLANLGAWNVARTFTTPSNATLMRTAVFESQWANSYQIEKGTTSTPYEPYKTYVKNLNLQEDVITDLSQEIQGELSKKLMYTLNDAWVAWRNGEKFPIAFYSDSTTDGVGTTGWVGNTLGADSINAKAYPKLLENKLRSMTGNNVLRIYNAGFSGKTADWGLANFDAEFTGTSVYKDVKMIGIGFGVNDRVIYNTEKAYRIGFKEDIIAIIEKCFLNNIQPFLMTTQAIISPGVRTTDAATYPMRDAQRIATIANEVKMELAKDYGLEIINVSKFTEEFLLYSQIPSATIIADKLHFGDVGHEYEAGLMFAHVVPYTNFVKERTKLDYSSQRIFKGVPEDWVTNPTTFTGEFKTFVNTTLKGNTNDLLIYSTYVFVDAKRKMTLKAYKNDAATLTYIKVNGVVTQLDALEKTIGNLDLGLHHLEVWTGAHGTADFKGFIIE